MRAYGDWLKTGLHIGGCCLVTNWGCGVAFQDDTWCLMKDVCIMGNVGATVFVNHLQYMYVYKGEWTMNNTHWNSCFTLLYKDDHHLEIIELTWRNKVSKISQEKVKLTCNADIFSGKKHSLVCEYHSCLASKQDYPSETIKICKDEQYIELYLFPSQVG